jgi:hypothetical protein
VSLSFGPFGPYNVSRLLSNVSRGPWMPLRFYNQYTVPMLWFGVLLRSICPLTIAISLVYVTPLENLIIHLQFVSNLELCSSEFLLVFFVS